MTVIKTLKPQPILCLDIEIACANWFGTRQHLIVPNISWGLGLSHELDLAVVTRSGYLTEVEIKTSAADLRRDLLKTHAHASPKICRYFLAVPKPLVELGLQTFPSLWGVLSVGADGRYVEKIRDAKRNKDARCLSVDELNHLYELGAMRIWTLKQTLSDRIRRERLPPPLTPRR